MIGLEKYREEIRIGKPFWGHLPISQYLYNWNQAVKLLDSHPKDIVDKNYQKFRVSLNNSHLRPSLPSFGKSIYDEINKLFVQNSNTLISFIGFGSENFSYPWHKDKMDVCLLQVIGDMNIRVENTEYEKSPRPFNTGDWVYIPRGNHHEIITDQSRMTFSFGIEGEPNPKIYI